MEIKLLEVRDRGTFIPVLCVLMDEPANEAQRYYLRRCGYPLDGSINIAMTSLHVPSTSCDCRYPGEGCLSSSVSSPSSVVRFSVSAPLCMRVIGHADRGGPLRA
jgi:hypothetical protein